MRHLCMRVLSLTARCKLSITQVCVYIPKTFFFFSTAVNQHQSHQFYQQRVFSVTDIVEASEAEISKGTRTVNMDDMIVIIGLITRITEETLQVMVENIGVIRETGKVKERIIAMTRGNLPVIGWALEVIERILEVTEETMVVMGETWMKKEGVVGTISQDHFTMDTVVMRITITS